MTTSAICEASALMSLGGSMGASARPAHKRRARRHVLVFFTRILASPASLYTEEGRKPPRGMFERWHARRARSCAPLAINYCMRAMALLGSKCSNWRVANAIGFPGEGGSPPPSQTLPTDQSRICLAAHSRAGGRLLRGPAARAVRRAPRGTRLGRGLTATHSSGQ